MRGRVLLVGVVLCLSTGVPSADAYIYWSSFDGTTSNIGRASPDGTNVNPVLVSNVYAGAVAADGTYLYWASDGDGATRQGAVGRATVDGGNVNGAFQTAGAYCGVFDLAIDATDLYWLKSRCSAIPPQSINRAPKSGGQPYTEPVLAANMCGIAIDDTYVYWSAGRYIGRALLNGGSPDPTWLDVGATIQACGIAVNSSHVFWTVDAINGVFQSGTSIGRTTIDGAEASVSNNFISGLGYPTAVAVEGGFIYWTDRPDVFDVAGRVGRANLDGSSVNPNFIPEVLNPHGVAVDSAGPGGPEGTPIHGRQVTVRPISGTVLIKRPGESAFSELTAAETIPIGSLIDTREGTVELTVAYKGDKKLETAKFKYGLFKVTQSTKKGAFTVLKLKGELERCAKRKLASPRRAAKKGGRRLWGSGRGHFTSRGHRGSGSARGTIWQVSDRCNDTTLIASIKGKVWARDLTNGKRVVLKTGERYVAGAKKRR